MLRRQILLSFKFIADLAYRGFIDISNTRDILATLIKLNDDHIDFFNLGKIVLIFCGLGHLMFDENNKEILQMFMHVIKESASHI